MTGKMIAAMVDLRIQSRARQRICTRVNRWIRRRGTWRRKAWSGWCLAGMRKSLQRSQNWQEYIAQDSTKRSKAYWALGLGDVMPGRVLERGLLIGPYDRLMVSRHV